MSLTKPLLIALCTTIGTAGMAQLPLVDITLVDAGAGELEVRVRPDGNFNELFSSLVFTIRWETASNANLDAISQPIPQILYMPIGKSGNEEDASGFRYQVFAGFGFTPLSSAGVSWTAGMEVTLMTIPVINGTSVFEIVNDSWTANFNGDFFASLNGSDQTGDIYQVNTGIPTGHAGAALELLPNPTESTTWLTITLPEVQDVDARMLNTAGQIVWQRQWKNTSGTIREPIDVAHSGQGIYVVQVEAGNQHYVRRLVVR